MEANSNKNNHRKFQPSIGMIIAVLTGIAALFGWFITYGSQQEKIRQAFRDVATLEKRLYITEKWQREWPTSGELAMDREQNLRLSSIEGIFKEHRNLGGLDHPTGVMIRVERLNGKLLTLESDLSNQRVLLNRVLVK